MSKHTPGPWVRITEGKFDYIHATDTWGNPAEEIAAIVNDKFEDANLIASAPALLAENERLRAALLKLADAVLRARQAHDYAHSLPGQDDVTDADIERAFDTLEDAEVSVILAEGDARAALAREVQP